MKASRPADTAHDSFRVIALMSAYNEGDVISPVIEHLIANGVDVYLLDNRSTDDTVKQAGRWLGKGLLEIETFPADVSAQYAGAAGRYDWTAILRRKEELSRTLDASWFIHHDADEIRDSPWSGVTIKEALRFVDSVDYNCIDFRVFEFPPIDDGFRQGMDPATYFTRFRDAKAFDQLQLKGWKKRSGPVSLVHYGGHDVEFEGRRVFPIPFLLRHYPIRGQSHGRRKVFEERKTRFVAEERAKSWHQQYDHVQDEAHVFLVDPETLRPFDLDHARLDAQLWNRDALARKRASDSALADLTAGLATLERQMAARQTESDAEQEVLSLAHRDAALSAAEKLNALLGTAERSRAEHAAKVATLEAELARSSAAHELSERTAADLRDRLDKAESARAALAVKASALEVSVTSMRAARDAQQTASDELRRQLTALEVSQVQWAGKVATLEAELRDASMARDAEQRSASALQISLNDLRATFAKEQAAVAYLQTTFAKEQAAVAYLQTTLASEQAARQSLQTTLASEQAAVEYLQTKFAKEQAAVAYLQQVIRNLERDLQRHREALTGVLNSKTWRWGEPLGRFLMTITGQGHKIARPQAADRPSETPAPAATVQSPAPNPTAPPASSMKDAAIDKLRDLKSDLGNSGAIGKLLVPPVEVAEFSLTHGLKEVVVRSKLRLAGKEPWRELQGQESAAATLPPPQPRHPDVVPHTVSHAPVKVIAFYLPQYHPIPENDAAWGKGFTEWTNTTRARPLFDGHYQPHMPGDLGFYDLRVPETRNEQARLARSYGIHGFCYYYYWFDRRRLLDRPLDDMLRSGTPDFPFCICWANEPWSRRWDGSEHEVIASQEYNSGYAERFIQDVMPILQDPRYIRVDGRPLLIVYRLDQLPDPQAAASIWREACRTEGIGEICLAAMGTYGTTDPLPFGFDVSIEFPPHNLTVVPSMESKVAGLSSGFNGRIFDYATCAEAELRRRPKYPQFRGLMPGWDNTARRGQSAMLFHGSTPVLYEGWLHGVLNLATEASAPHSPFVFVNAWNEWAEGTHLEPDQKYGHEYLEATAAALLRHKYGHLFEQGFRSPAGTPDVAIVIPAYNHVDVTLACLESLARHESRYSFEVLVVDDGSRDLTERLAGSIPGLRYLRSEINQGFVRTCNLGAAAARAEYVVFLNNDTTVRDGWLDELRGTFDAWPRAGLVGSKLIWPNGRMQECGSLIYRDGSAENYGREGDPDDPRYGYARPTDYVTGAAMMIRRELFHELGGFDEIYAPGYYEDVDLAFQVRKAGLQVIVNPRAAVTHFEGGTSGLDVTVGAKRYQVINHTKFRDRWKSTLDGFPERDGHRKIASRDKRVLVIDWTVPRPDRDSGSVRMAAILRVIAELGYSVTFMSRDVSCDPRYAAELERIGIQVLREPYVTSVQKYLELEGADFGHVIVSRRDVAAMHLETVKKYCKNARVVFDTVDLHFIREMREREVERGRTQAEIEAFDAHKNREIDLIKMADATLVVSTYERDVLARMFPRLDIRVVSNVHDVSPTPRRFADRAGLLFVGYFVHKPNADAVRWFVNDVLPLVRIADPDFRVHIVGSDPPPDILAMSTDRVKIHGYVADIDALFDACRMSIAPLRYGAGVKGKIGQSLALGVPCVTTTIGAEGMALEDGISAMIADDAAGFAARIERLYGDQALWERLRERGLDTIQRTMSADAARVELMKLFEASRPAHGARPTEQIHG